MRWLTIMVSHCFYKKRNLSQKFHWKRRFVKYTLSTIHLSKMHTPEPISARR